MSVQQKSAEKVKVRRVSQVPSVDVNVNISSVMKKRFKGFYVFVFDLQNSTACSVSFPGRRKLTQARETSSHEDCDVFVPVDTGLTSVAFGSQRIQNQNAALQEHNGNVRFQEKYFCCSSQCKDCAIRGSWGSGGGLNTENTEIQVSGL